MLCCRAFMPRRAARRFVDEISPRFECELEAASAPMFVAMQMLMPLMF